MLTTVDKLRGYTIQATDGNVGKVEELYFDEESWAVRYLVVNVGNWLMRQRVLVVPSIIEDIDQEAETAVVPLTQEQIENSPDIDTHKPISRENEEMLHEHYEWDRYWMTMPLMGTRASAYTAPVPPTVPSEVAALEQKSETGEGTQSTLRSTKEVTGYDVYASDSQNSFGHVETFLVDTLSWIVRYVVVDTGRWLPGKKVLVAPMWVSSIRWAESDMYLKLTETQVEKSPEYDPEQFIYRQDYRDYEVRLYEHYDQPPYWHGDAE